MCNCKCRNKIDSITINELARALEPEAWLEADAMEKKGLTPLFEINLKCVQSLNAAAKALKYLRG